MSIHRWSAVKNNMSQDRQERPDRVVKETFSTFKNEPDDKETITREEWRPSEEQFDQFLTRDLQLASSNVAMALRNKGIPMSFRDLKEQLLHSADTVERVLTSKIADGSIRENRGRFELTR